MKSYSKPEIDFSVIVVNHTVANDSGYNFITTGNVLSDENKEMSMITPDEWWTWEKF